MIKGIREVRWGRAGSDKSGGARVIYFTRNTEGEVVLLELYAKAKTGNLTGPQLKEIRRVPGANGARLDLSDGMN